MSKIATNGTDFLVVWVDNPDDLRARRITAAGEILDPVGIPIDRSWGPFAVASDGDGWLIAHNIDLETRVVRVERDGTVGTPIELFKMDELALAWNGTNFLLAGANVTGVNVRALARDGSPLENWRTVHPTGRYPAVASNGPRFLVAWWNNRALEARIDDGPVQVIAEEGLPIPPTLAASGDSWLVAWVAYQLTTVSREVRARAIGTDGTLGDPFHVEGVYTAVLGSSALARVGDAYFLAWIRPVRENAMEIVGSFFDERGRATREPVLLAPLDLQFALPSVAATATTQWTVWTRFTRRTALAPDVVDVEARRIEETAPRRIALAAGEQSTPFAIRHGNSELAVWSEQVGADRKPTLFAARVTPAGALDGEGVVVHPSENQQLAPVISAAPEPLLLWSERAIDSAVTTLVAKPLGSTREPAVLGTINGGAPAAVWTGTAHFVVWRSGAAIVAARVLPSGVVLDATPIRIADRAQNPSVAFDGENLLVGWNGAYDAYCHWGCVEVKTSVVRLFSPEGVALAPAVGLSEIDRSAPGVAWNGSEFAAFWIAQNGQLRGRRIGRDGAAIDAAARTLGDFATSATFGVPPATWTGTEWALALPDLGHFSVVRVARDFGAFREARIDTQSEAARPGAIVVRPSGDLAVAYERILRHAPFGGAQRALLHYEAGRRRAVR